MTKLRETDRMVIDSMRDEELLALYLDLEEANETGEHDGVLDAINDELDWRCGVADGQLEMFPPVQLS